MKISPKVTVDMDRQQIFQLKLLILLLISVGIVYVNMDVVSLMVWGIMWSLILVYGRGVNCIDKKLIKNLLIDLMIFVFELIIGIIVRIKVLLVNKQIRKNKNRSKNLKIRKREVNREIFTNNMISLIKAHNNNIQTANATTQTKNTKNKYQNKSTVIQGRVTNYDKLGAKPKHNIRKETKSTNNMNDMSELFLSQDTETRSCISCRNSFVVFFIGHTWLEANLCSLCRFDVRNYIYQIWCYSCKTMLLEKTEPSKGQNLCVFCRPNELKSHNYYQYIKCNRKNIEYFCGCNTCLTGDIQGCKNKPCAKCSNPKPKVP